MLSSEGPGRRWRLGWWRLGGRRPSFVRGGLVRGGLIGSGLVVATLFVTGCSSGGSETSPSIAATAGSVLDTIPSGSVASGAVPAASTPASPADVTEPSQPDGVQPEQVQPGGVQPEGFTTVTAQITAADGEVCVVCLWLADSADERGRGLMGVTDLGDAAGMAFVFDPATTGSFYMFQTPTPLSIAWFGADGSWVGAADMEPCLDTTSDRCALYSPGGASYTIGVETFAGGLEPLLMVEGSVIELIAGTEAPECQTPSSQSGP